MAQVVKDIKTWLTQWFYLKTDIDPKVSNLQSQIDNKLSKNLTTANQNVVTDGAGNVVVEAKPTIPSASNSTPVADTTNGSVGNATTFARANHTHPKSSIYAEATHSHSASQLTDSSANTYTNISSSLTTSSTQADINSAINTKIGELVGIDFITVVQTLPTASSSTMGKLYLVPISDSGDNKFAEYVTVHQNSSYDWEKLGEISGSGLSVDWSDITGKPSSFTPSSHTHGQVTNDGKITSTAVTVASGDNIVITDASDSSKVKRVANLLTSHIKDGTAHSNIGSSANATQSTINANIDTALGNKANTSSLPSNTSELNNDGEDGSDPYIGRGEVADHYIQFSNTNGLVKNDGTIDTTTYISDVSGKSDKTATIGTTITLVDAGETNEGCIIFNTIS